MVDGSSGINNDPTVQPSTDGAPADTKTEQQSDQFDQEVQHKPQKTQKQDDYIEPEHTPLPINTASSENSEEAEPTQDAQSKDSQATERHHPAKAGKGYSIGMDADAGGIDGNRDCEGELPVITDDTSTEELIYIAAHASGPDVIDDLIDHPNSNTDVLTALANNETLGSEAIPVIADACAEQVVDFLTDPDATLPEGQAPFFDVLGDNGLSLEAQELFAEELAYDPSEESAFLASLLAQNETSDPSILNTLASAFIPLFQGNGTSDTMNHMIGMVANSIVGNPNADNTLIGQVLGSDVGLIPQVIATAVTNLTDPNMLQLVAEVYFTAPDAMYPSASDGPEAQAMVPAFEALLDNDQLPQNVVTQMMNSPFGQSLGIMPAITSGHHQAPLEEDVEAPSQSTSQPQGEHGGDGKI